MASWRVSWLFRKQQNMSNKNNRKTEWKRKEHGESEGGEGRNGMPFTQKMLEISFLLFPFESGLRVRGVPFSSECKTISPRSPQKTKIKSEEIHEQNDDDCFEWIIIFHMFIVLRGEISARLCRDAAEKPLSTFFSLLVSFKCDLCVRCASREPILSDSLFEIPFSIPAGAGKVSYEFVVSSPTPVRLER